jgi:hypothetical protein
MDDTVREDLGYREGEMKDQVYPQRVRFPVDKKRVRYTQGELKGEERELCVAIAGT